MKNQYKYVILDREGLIQDRRNIYAPSMHEAEQRVQELRTEGETWRFVEMIPGKPMGMPELQPHERFLMAVVLEMASNVFGEHGCNDFDLSKYMTSEQGKEFMRQYHEYNGDPEEFSDDEYNGWFQDYAVMGFLAHKIYPEGNIRPFLPD